MDMIEPPDEPSNIRPISHTGKLDLGKLAAAMESGDVDATKEAMGLDRLNAAMRQGPTLANIQPFIVPRGMSIEDAIITAIDTRTELEDYDELRMPETIVLHFEDDPRDSAMMLGTQPGVYNGHGRDLRWRAIFQHAIRMGEHEIHAIYDVEVKHEN